MGFSEIPPPPELDPGQDLPVIRTRPPGPQSRTWLTRMARVAAPMGPAPTQDLTRVVKSSAPPHTIVYSTAKGCNVIDVDGNRYVDFAAGFGSLLLGHAHPRVLMALELQSKRLLQGLGDVFPSEPKIALMERLAELSRESERGVILGQSGADAVTASLKSALLYTGKPGVIAFEGAYHGLSYAPLAACSFRPSYREPFAPQLGSHTRFIPFPSNQSEAELSLERLRLELSQGDVGAVLFEPIQGRGGCVVPPEGFIDELLRLCARSDALSIADEIWTGLGRTGSWLASESDTASPDLLCLGKGLGGGLPISACIGRTHVLAAWQRSEEVVHTSTFAGAPLACTTALSTLDILRRDDLPERARVLGEQTLERLRDRFADHPKVREVRGRGLMLGIDLGAEPGAASRVARRLLERGFLTTTGGGLREVLVLTPPLLIADSLLSALMDALSEAL